MRRIIAIVEDDVQQRELYAEALRAHDYDVAEYESRESAIGGFELSLPDLAILDIALNSDVGGGYEVCRYLKQRDSSLPVIFLTSRGDELDKIYGLQLGAWDYQTKPVSLDYLIVRIESFFQIKQWAKDPETSAVVTQAEKIIGDLQINIRTMQCFWKTEEVNLTPTEFAILKALVDTQEPVGIEDLISSTRQGVVEDNTVNTHILHIRKKFKSIDEDFRCIKTRYGFGYQWLCE